MMNLLFDLLTGNIVYAFITPGLFLGAIMILFSRFAPAALVQYKIPALFGGIFLVLFFTFYAGKYSEESKWKLQLAEQQAQIQALKAHSAEMSIQTVTKYIDRVKVIEKEKLVYVNSTPWITQSTINAFPLPNGAIRVLDAAASGSIPETPSASDGAASEIKIDQAVSVIAENYTDCRIYAERLSSLQEWVRTQETLFSKE
ncbi:hypothetical protein UFOVP116_239 [uncultured Caudovirales phage]|uniref:Uncharacterized protein n=1 Tax=uncultured Caudovirales phage TaxID=2100421 RepID=A0A6J5LEH1_9CAUD|nr:hypothetical protein UFOVP116_239 [uncultured Caudovirales phage]